MKKNIFKIIICSLLVFVLFGCKNNNSIIGKFEAIEYYYGDIKYTKEDFEKRNVTVTVEFKEDGTCIRNLNGTEKTFTYDEKYIIDGEVKDEYTFEDGILTIVQDDEKIIMKKVK